MTVAMIRHVRLAEYRQEQKEDFKTVHDRIDRQNAARSVAVMVMLVGFLFAKLQGWM